MKNLLKLILISFWLVMLGLLVRKAYLAPSAVIALDVVTEEGVRTGDEWFGIYQGSRKIGYAHTSLSREADTYRLSEESEMDLLVLGTIQRVRTEINGYTTRNFQLKYFDFAMKSGGTSITIKGAVVRRKLLLDIVTGDQVRSERILITDPPHLSPTIKPSLILLGLEPGRKYRFPLFNPATMRTEEATIAVESRESIKVGDTEQIVYKLKETFQGMEAYSWMTQDGDVIREESPLGYVLLKESKEEARKLDKQGPAVDILSLVKISAEPIDNPAQTKYLRVRLEGPSLDGFELNGDRQQVSGNIVEIRVPEIPTGYDIPYSGRGQAESLQATALIQSDDRRIRGRASDILGGEKNAREAAAKLNAWVYSAVRKQPVVSIPSAVEVLAQLTGDCNEHTTLYTALARSAGIPARMAAGIVYMRDGFYYHAWPEVWLGEWVALDPTFNQFPADATHIRFITGSLDRQSDILKLVGKLKVDVLEYR